MPGAGLGQLYPDLLAGGHDLILGHAVDSLDVIDPFLPVLVSLMHAVDPEIAGIPPGQGGRRSPIGAFVDRVLVQCRRFETESLPSRRLYRWETEIRERVSYLLSP